MRILFASAEFAPFAVVGGLASASSGLVRELRAMGHDVQIVVPDYGDVALANESLATVACPEWAGAMDARRGIHEAAGAVILIGSERIRRPHPYTDADGAGWPDNDQRFFAFSAAVAAIANEWHPDVLHLNDWHTSVAAAFVGLRIPVVLTVHNLGYQGTVDGGWLARLGERGAAFERFGACNPLAGGLRLADAIVVVSPNYRAEILQEGHAFGLHDLLVQRQAAMVGIRNGIETDQWDPSTDPMIPFRFDAPELANKAKVRAELRDELHLDVGTKSTSLSVVLSRLVDQKGIDFITELVPLLEGVPTQLAVLGAGDQWIADSLRASVQQFPGRVAFVDGYDHGLGHRLLAGGDLLLMPSRFEPCGLTQMQAMRYGTIPVVTGVGGLVDTVIDADGDRSNGTGFIAANVSAAGILDAWHRAQRAWLHPQRRAAIQRRGMTTDWSWREPARQHVELYERICVTKR